MAVCRGRDCPGTVPERRQDSAQPAAISHFWAATNVLPFKEQQPTFWKKHPLIAVEEEQPLRRNSTLTSYRTLYEQCAAFNISYTR